MLTLFYRELSCSLFIFSSAGYSVGILLIERIVNHWERKERKYTTKQYSSRNHKFIITNKYTKYLSLNKN